MEIKECLLSLFADVLKIALRRRMTGKGGTAQEK